MDLDSKHPILYDNRRQPDGISVFRFNGRGKHRQVTGGVTPPTPCEIGTWDFSMECQSAHLMTAGLI